MKYSIIFSKRGRRVGRVVYNFVKWTCLIPRGRKAKVEVTGGKQGAGSLIVRRQSRQQAQKATPAVLHADNQGMTHGEQEMIEPGVNEHIFFRFPFLFFFLFFFHSYFYLFFFWCLVNGRERCRKTAQSWQRCSYSPSNFFFFSFLWRITQTYLTR